MNQMSFGDWRIRLGIVLGVLVFSGTMAALDIHADEAWWTIRIITLGMLGAMVVSDFQKVRE